MLKQIVINLDGDALLQGIRSATSVLCWLATVLTV